MTEAEHGTEAVETGHVDAKPETGDQELLDLLRRERADFLNYKRRVEQERVEDRERAHAALLTRLLPLLDELDRALPHAPKELETHPWVQGVALIHRHLQMVLRELGIEKVGVEGEPFAPERHEALLYEGPPSATDRRVGTVIRPGYRMGDRLLRPAQVFVVGAEPLASNDPVGQGDDLSEKPKPKRARRKGRADDDRNQDTSRGG